MFNKNSLNRVRRFSRQVNRLVAPSKFAHTTLLSDELPNPALCRLCYNLPSGGGYASREANHKQHQAETLFSVFYVLDDVRSIPRHHTLLLFTDVHNYTILSGHFPFTFTVLSTS